MDDTTELIQALAQQVACPRACFGVTGSSLFLWKEKLTESVVMLENECEMIRRET